MKCFNKKPPQNVIRAHWHLVFMVEAASTATDTYIHHIYPIILNFSITQGLAFFADSFSHACYDQLMIEYHMISHTTGSMQSGLYALARADLYASDAIYTQHCRNRRVWTRSNLSVLWHSWALLQKRDCCTVYLYTRTVAYLKKGGARSIVHNFCHTPKTLTAPRIDMFFKIHVHVAG